MVNLLLNPAELVGPENMLKAQKQKTVKHLQFQMWKSVHVYGKNI